MHLRTHVYRYIHTYASTDNNFTRVLSLTMIVANSREWLGIIAIGTSIDVLPSKNQALCEYCTHNGTFK